MEDRKPAYWAVIPAGIRYDEELRPNAKLIYAEISAMSDATGFCWATNRYLADLFGLTKNTVSELVAQLAERGYVRLEIVKGDNGNIVERRIWLAEVHPPIPKNRDTPIPKKTDTPIPKNREENSTSIEHIPPIVPQGGRRRKPEHKDTPDWEPERFAKLWQWYPHDKRGNKQRAIRAWEQLHPDRDLIDRMAEALQAKSRTEEWKRGVGIPHLSTYLNGYGWEEYEPGDLPDGEDEEGGIPVL